MDWLEYEVCGWMSTIDIMSLSYFFSGRSTHVDVGSGSALQRTKPRCGGETRIGIVVSVEVLIAGSAPTA
jgi:hypothetical protein